MKAGVVCGGCTLDNAGAEGGCEDVGLAVVLATWAAVVGVVVGDVTREEGKSKEAVSSAPAPAGARSQSQRQQRAMQMHLSGALAGDLRALAQWEGGAQVVLIGRLGGFGGQRSAGLPTQRSPSLRLSVDQVEGLAGIWPVSLTPRDTFFIL